MHHEIVELAKKLAEVQAQHEELKKFSEWLSSPDVKQLSGENNSLKIEFFSGPTILLPAAVVYPMATVTRDIVESYVVALKVEIRELMFPTKKAPDKEPKEFIPYRD